MRSHTLLALLSKTQPQKYDDIKRISDFTSFTKPWHGIICIVDAYFCQGWLNNSTAKNIGQL